MRRAASRSIRAAPATTSASGWPEVLRSSAKRAEPKITAATGTVAQVPEDPEPEARDAPGGAERDFHTSATPHRVAHLRKRILQHQPKAVIFYGRSYRAQWEQIADSAFRHTGVPDLDVAIGPTTVFALTPHPTYTGITNAFFEQAGRVVAELVAQAE